MNKHGPATCVVNADIAHAHLRSQHRAELGSFRYDWDEARVAHYLVGLTGIGGGDDPVGFLIASHAALVEEKRLAAASAPAPLPMETLCTCSHAKGMHWHRPTGVEACGEESCTCEKFAPATQPHPELCAEYVKRPTPPETPIKAVLWTGANLDEVRKVYPGLGVDYMLDKGCRVGDYVVCPDKGFVRFWPADRFHAAYMPAPTAKKALPECAHLALKTDFCGVVRCVDCDAIVSLEGLLQHESEHPTITAPDAATPLFPPLGGFGNTVVTITVSGPPKSGKTTIISLIEEFMVRHWWQGIVRLMYEEKTIPPGDAACE